MSTEKTAQRDGFLRLTITIPAELETFIESRRKSPLHAGNLSSYVRSLIIADQAAHPPPQLQEAAP